MTSFADISSRPAVPISTDSPLPGGSLLPLEDSPYLLDEHGPLFILGRPRSGTIFLSKCIADIPDVEEFVGVLAPPRIMHLIGYASITASQPTNCRNWLETFSGNRSGVVGCSFPRAWSPRPLPKSSTSCCGNRRFREGFSITKSPSCALPRPASPTNSRMRNSSTSFAMAATTPTPWSVPTAMRSPMQFCATDF